MDRCGISSRRHYVLFGTHFPMFRMRDERKFLLPLGRRAERPHAKAAKAVDQLMRRLEQEAAPASTRPLSRVRVLESSDHIETSVIGGPPRLLPANVINMADPWTGVVTVEGARPERCWC